MRGADSNILVIDNNRISRMVIEDEFRSLGCRISVADSGAQGLDIASTLAPDLITIEASLGDTTGVEFMTRLKGSDKTRDIPCIVVTGVDDPTQRELCYRAGAINVTQKPFFPGALNHIAKSHLEMKQRTSGRNILVVEDSNTMRAITKHLLERQGHTAIVTCDGKEGWDALVDGSGEIDMVVTDINMPKMDGRQLVEKIRGDHRFQFIPIVVSSTIAEKESVKLLLSMGADDYIVKPFSTEEFGARILSHLRVKSLYEDLSEVNLRLANFNETLELRVEERTVELKDANMDAIFSLASAAEAKDYDTGFHVNRIQNYSKALAIKIGVPHDQAEEIGYSSIMHDVGKISIPDKILQKPGKLTVEEFEIMKAHSSQGQKILSDKPFFAQARTIARHHHEKWDGTGYPDGLAGDDIPLAARIVAVADVFDALTNKRSYKEAWTIVDAIAELEKMAASHLDPNLVKAWVELYNEGQIEKIFNKWK